MKINSITRACALLVLLVAGQQAIAQTTAFTYQGQLNDHGSPATGVYDLRFAIYDLSSGGVPLGPALTNSGVVLSNGLFSVTLDFGNQFPGADRWLEIGVVTNGGGAFSTLAPRQLLTSTPYAVRAANFSGTIAAAQLSGTYTGAVTFNNAANSFTGGGSGLTGVNASTLGGLTSSQFWRTAGNSGTTAANFVGTMDNQALDFRVFNQRGLRLQPNTNGAPTIIGGSLSNVVSANVPGATIAGGDRNTIFSIPGLDAEFTSEYAVIGGGSSNYIDTTSYHSVIGGGFQNYISGNGFFSTIGGGIQNSILNTAAYSTIGGGQGNTLGQVSAYSVIGGGYSNTLDHSTSYAVIAGGQNNIIRSNAPHSVISGGWNNVIQANAEHASVVGGNNNRIEADADFASIGGGGGSIVSAPFGVIGGGWINVIRSNAQSAVIAGGQFNTISTNSSYSLIGGGLQNNILNGALSAVIAGGQKNGIGTNASESVIGGGTDNTNNALFAVIAGGSSNTIGTNSGGSVISGGFFNRISTNAFENVIAGGDNHTIEGNSVNSVVGGGFGNHIKEGSSYSVIGGGQANQITNSADYATIPGGFGNTASGQNSFAAGQFAGALHQGTFVWADSSTSAGFNSTSPNQFLIRAAGGVGIGIADPAYPLHVAGPIAISTSGAGADALVLGIERSWAFRQLGSGSTTGLELVSIGGGGNKNFIINTTGLVGIGTVNPLFTLEVNGTAGKPGGGSWSVASDRRLKKNIRPLAGALDKLLALRGVNFEYIDPAKVHELSGERMGLVAQEVEQVLPDWVETGPDGYKRVTVRGLEALVVEALRELRAELGARLTEELKRREVENAELKARLDKLEQLLADRMDGGAL